MSISVSDGILRIENGVLTHVNPKAEKIVIPKSVERISVKAFGGCTKLSLIEFEPGGEYLELIDLPGWLGKPHSKYEGSFLYNGYYYKEFDKILDCINK